VEAADPCSGWYCLFEHQNYGGRRLRFRDCCYFQYLSNYGFANKATSWRNWLYTNNDMRVWDSGPSPDVLLWCSDYGSNPNVGTADNDKADYLYIQSSDDYCD